MSHKISFKFQNYYRVFNSRTLAQWSNSCTMIVTVALSAEEMTSNQHKPRKVKRTMFPRNCIALFLHHGLVLLVLLFLSIISACSLSISTLAWYTPGASSFIEFSLQPAACLPSAVSWHGVLLHHGPWCSAPPWVQPAAYPSPPSHGALLHSSTIAWCSSLPWVQSAACPSSPCHGVYKYCLVSIFILCSSTTESGVPPLMSLACSMSMLHLHEFSLQPQLFLDHLHHCLPLPSPRPPLTPLMGGAHREGLEKGQQKVKHGFILSILAR